MLDFDDYETYMVLLKVCKDYAVDPSASVESEDFFRRLLSEYTGGLDSKSIMVWLAKQIENHFIAVGERPTWIQSAQWPFANSEPMIFVGQIDLSVQEKGIVSKIYHDDTSLYIFIGRKVEPVVIIQQF